MSGSAGTTTSDSRTSRSSSSIIGVLDHVRSIMLLAFVGGYVDVAGYLKLQ